LAPPRTHIIIIIIIILQLCKLGIFCREDAKVGRSLVERCKVRVGLRTVGWIETWALGSWRRWPRFAF